MSFKGMSCIFPVPDMKKTTAFYVSELGFRAVEYIHCKEPHVCLYRDDIEIILLKANTDKIMPNHILYGYGFDAYLYTEHQEALEKEFSERNVKFISHMSITDYQNKQFVIEDCDGRRLAVGLKIKA